MTGEHCAMCFNVADLAASTEVGCSSHGVARGAGKVDGLVLTPYQALLLLEVVGRSPPPQCRTPRTCGAIQQSRAHVVASFCAWITRLGVDRVSPAHWIECRRRLAGATEKARDGCQDTRAVSGGLGLHHDDESVASLKRQGIVWQVSDDEHRPRSPAYLG